MKKYCWIFFLILLIFNSCSDFGAAVLPFIQENMPETPSELVDMSVSKYDGILDFTNISETYLIARNYNTNSKKCTIVLQINNNESISHTVSIPVNLNSDEIQNINRVRISNYPCINGNLIHGELDESNKKLIFKLTENEATTFETATTQADVSIPDTNGEIIDSFHLTIIYVKGTVWFRDNLLSFNAGKTELTFSKSKPADVQYRMKINYRLDTLVYNDECGVGGSFKYDNGFLYAQIDKEDLLNQIENGVFSKEEDFYFYVELHPFCSRENFIQITCTVKLVD